MKAMRMKNWLLALALGVVVACSGRTEAPPGEGLLLSELQAGPGVGCVLSSTPEELPTVDSLVDHGLAEEIRELSHHHDLGPSHAVFSLSFTEDGSRLRRDLIEHSFPDTLAGAVREITYAALRDLAEERDEEAPVGWELLEMGAQRDWGVRLRVDFEGIPEGEVHLRVGRQEVCAPRPRDPGLEDQLAGVVAAGPRYRQGRRERVVIMDVLIHPNGFVVGAQIAEGEARGGTLERRLRDHVRQFSFHPATVDGIPTYGNIAIPVRIPG